VHRPASARLEQRDDGRVDVGEPERPLDPVGMRDDLGACPLGVEAKASTAIERDWRMGGSWAEIRLMHRRPGHEEGKVA
jgi:hypothetical protein